MAPVASTPLEIRLATVNELRERGQALFDAHWREAGHAEGLQANRVWPFYYAAEAGNGVLALSAWEGDALVGYSVSFLQRHHHCRDLFHCLTDAIFVVPEKRRAGIGLRLIRETELAARERGAREITWHAPQGSPLELILCRLGYRVREVTYERAL